MHLAGLVALDAEAGESDALVDLVALLGGALCVAPGHGFLARGASRRHARGRRGTSFGCADPC